MDDLTGGGGHTLSAPPSSGLSGQSAGEQVIHVDGLQLRIDSRALEALDLRFAGYSTTRPAPTEGSLNCDGPRDDYGDSEVIVSGLVASYGGYLELHRGCLISQVWIGVESAYTVNSTGMTALDHDASVVVKVDGTTIATVADTQPTWNSPAQVFLFLDTYDSKDRNWTIDGTHVFDESDSSTSRRVSFNDAAGITVPGL
jgi:hypothetical protein